MRKHKLNIHVFLSTDEKMKSIGSLRSLYGSQKSERFAVAHFSIIHGLQDGSDCFADAQIFIVHKPAGMQAG